MKKMKQKEAADDDENEEAEKKYKKKKEEEKIEKNIRKKREKRKEREKKNCRFFHNTFSSLHLVVLCGNFPSHDPLPLSYPPSPPLLLYSN